MTSPDHLRQTRNRAVRERDDAVGHFDSISEHYRAGIIRELSEADEIAIYRQGSFVELRRGLHLPCTGNPGMAFKLVRLAVADAVCCRH